MTKYVYDFSEGNKDMKDLLGGKGANLAEMTNMGLPVPPGFTITTEACLTFLKQGGPPPEMLEEAGKHLVHLQEAMGRNLGDPDDPLLVSVRSGAKFSMPGMMDTVLNLGLNDESVKGLAKQTGGDMRFANDAYRRFIQMFGKIVMDVPADAFEHALDAAKERRGPGTQDTDLDADDLAGLIERFRAIYQEHTGDAFPQDPSDQLRLAIDAVFSSWNGKRAIDYRRQNKISDDLGTAVNVQAMVFGNLGDDSGTGVAFTRDPATGQKVPYGDYLANAQGEDVVAGIRNTLRIADLEQLDPPAYAELRTAMDTLEGHYHDMCDIEFTIEKRKFWLLQTRVGKRTALAEWVIAHGMLQEGLIGPDEALLRVDANRLEELFKRRVRADGATPIAKGLNASPGAATGKVVFSADEAQEWASRGDHVILVRRETTPDDYHGMIASQGILTSAGGTNSHAAVVARGEGIPAVCGADAIHLDPASKSFTADGVAVKEGDVITIDGFTGDVYVGELPLEESVLEKARSGDESARQDTIWKAFEALMAQADAVRRMRVRANADTPDQATNARERGAEGIGLCRTEHMFLGEERVGAVRQMIFAETDDEEQAAYDVLLPLQREDFVGIFRAMSGLPVTVRLLDPPLHEFLPNQVELAVLVARAEERGEREIELRDAHLSLDYARTMLQKVNELHEANPMLGLRGVRLGIVKPGLYAMQVRAICEAAARVKKEGARPAGGDHDPAGRDGARAESDARRAAPGGRRRPATRGCRARPLGVGNHDRAPARRRHRRRDRPDRRVLLVRDERPHADGVRLQPRRHRQVRRDVRGAQAGAREPVRHGGQARRRAPDAHRLRGGQGRQPEAAPRHLRRARRRPGLGRVLPPDRPGLRELLAVSGRDRTAGGGPSGRGRVGVGLEISDVEPSN